jgi:serine/threonine protein kinase
MTVEPNEIQAIFMAALEKATPTERAAYLDAACAGNPSLRKRVEALLRAHDRPDRVLDQPAAKLLAAEVGAMPLDFLEPSDKPGVLGRLGHYEVLEVVGRGGMGIVLRAFDEKLHRVVAIKVLAPALATGVSARQRFVREARAAAAVSHDNVIDIHAVEDSGPVPYLVMQFIDGKTLQEKLDRTGPLPVTEILRIGLQIAEGLAAAHRHGLIHRDIKPANILLENGIERVKITDFGLARAVDDAKLTQSGVVAGTPAYMSPEQAHGDKVDHRSDLFSLGSVLYELCTGHQPFRAENTMAVLKRVCDETPRPIREMNPDIPEWLVTVVAKLQAKDPGQRFATAAEVVGLLSRCLTQLQMGADVTSLGSRSARPSGAQPGPSKRFLTGRRLSVAGVVVVGVLSALLTWYFTRPEAGTTLGHGPKTAIQPGGAPSLLLTGQERVELTNTKGMIDLNGTFTVEMWVKLGKGLNYIVGDETWDGVNPNVKRTHGWVLRIAENQTMNFTVAVDDRPGVEWTSNSGDPIVYDDVWHHLAISKSREGTSVFLDGKLYLHLKASNIPYVKSPTNIFLGPAVFTAERPVNCRFKAFRVSGKQLYSQPFTPPVEFTKTDDTLLLLDFSAGKGKTLPDLSGHGHDGTISRGGSWSSSEPAKP